MIRIVVLSYVFLASLILPKMADADASIRLSMDASGAIRYEASADVGPATPFAIASVGKTMTAVAVLRLVDHGLLTLDDPVSDLLPSDMPLSARDLEGIRLRHLLTMSSGLSDYYTDDWLEDALENPEQVQNVNGALDAVASEHRLFTPGRRFDYSNTNYVLLGAILEHATGEDYAVILPREVLEPAGMTDSFVFGAQSLPEDFAQDHPDRRLVRRYYAGSGMGDGGVIASARDVARFYYALFWKRELLSERMLTAMLQDATGAAYGMGIEIEDEIAGHSGGDLGFASDARIDLARGLIAVELIANEEAVADWPWDRVTTP